MLMVSLLKKVFGPNPVGCATLKLTFSSHEYPSVTSSLEVYRKRRYWEMIGKLEIPLCEELTVESEDGSTPEWAKKLYEEVREVVEQNIEWLKKKQKH